MNLKNNRASPLSYFKLCASFCSNLWIQTGVKSLETPNSGQNRQFLVPCDFEISQMTLKNNRAALLTYFKLCALFYNHQWIQTGFTVQKRPIWVKIGDYFSSVTCKFDRWPWKTIGHLSYPTSSFVHHFVGIGEFELELQSRKPQFGSKSANFCLCDLKIWRMTEKQWGTSLFYAISSFVHHFIAISEFKSELQYGNTQFG